LRTAFCGSIPCAAGLGCSTPEDEMAADGALWGNAASLRPPAPGEGV